MKVDKNEKRKTVLKRLLIYLIKKKVFSSKKNHRDSEDKAEIQQTLRENLFIAQKWTNQGQKDI